MFGNPSPGVELGGGSTEDAVGSRIGEVRLERACINGDFMCSFGKSILSRSTKARRNGAAGIAPERNISDLREDMTAKKKKKWRNNNPPRFKEEEPGGRGEVIVCLPRR